MKQLVRGGMRYDYSKVIHWCGSYINNNILEYTSKVLDDMPIVHIGTRRQYQGRTYLIGMLVEEPEKI